jgi:hypothetical protein
MTMGNVLLTNTKVEIVPASKGKLTLIWCSRDKVVNVSNALYSRGYRA